MARTLFIAIALSGLFWSGSAYAQASSLSNATVVSPCGSASYTAGQNRPVTQDTAGKQCVTTALGTTFSPTQVTLSTSATQVLASGTYASRQVCNTDAAITEYIGPSGVTSSTGMQLPPGWCWDASHTTAAIYAVAASATPVATAVQY